MGGKRAKKAPRAIQYLLNVDQRLQKISLRRISERLKKRPARPVRARNSTASRTLVHVPSPISARAIPLAVTCVVAAAALIAASQSRPGADVTRAANVSVPIAPARKSVRAPAVESRAKLAVVPAAQAAVVDSKAQPEVHNVAPVTITGCLERDGVTFWLKDTSGMPETPKARSWKSGFLKKRPSRVGLVSATNALKLPNYVGERVAATGALMDGHMRARSLRRVAASCK